MPTDGERSIRFKPRTVGDAVIGDAARGDGICASLSNLIWDPSTPNVLQCRPANLIENDANDNHYSAPPDVNQSYRGWSVGYQIDNIIYGLMPVIDGANTGKDYPVAYNLSTHAFIAVTGIVGANLPASLAVSGDYTPPQMTMTGVILSVAHTGFDGVANFFGWFDLTDPLNPAWNTGNTATHGLPSVPQACQTFNNRTYFGCKNVAYYTDTLALTMTNANQSLTIGDITNITCMAPLPVGTTSQGILQGILAFKAFNVFLITGDAAGTGTNGITPLGLNLLAPSVGTAAPRSVVPTPEGVRFVANDGIRDINFFGVLSQPDSDLALPFIYAVYPSRIAAAFSGNIYQISVQNGIATGSPFQVYWYDYRRRGWVGPHTSNLGDGIGGFDPGNIGYELIIPVSNDFLLFQNSNGNATFWNCYTVQSHGGTGITFIENDDTLNWTYTPAPMSDLDNIYANCAMKTTIELALPAQGDTYNFTGQNEDGSALATGSLMQPNNQTIWGSFNWGAANWGAAQGGLKPFSIPWNGTLVFNRLSIIGTGPSSLGLKLGAYRVGYKRLKYLLN